MRIRFASVMADIPMGEYRFLTLVSPEDPEGPLLFADGCGKLVNLVQPT